MLTVILQKILGQIKSPFQGFQFIKDGFSSLDNKYGSGYTYIRLQNEFNKDNYAAGDIAGIVIENSVPLPASLCIS